MIEKLDYIERLLTKLKSKRTEFYVISGIWHNLKRTDVKFVIQQYVQLPNGKYALADLYLPQLNYWVEVNEYFHTDKIDEDKERNNGIIKQTNGIQRHIYTYNPKTNQSYDIVDINKQIEDVVADIRLQIEKLGSNFIPWTNDNFLYYYQRKGKLSTSDYTCFPTIESIATFFCQKIRKRGYKRPGGFELPNTEFIVWMPNVHNQYWANILNSAKDEIIEYRYDANMQIDVQATRCDFSKSEERIVFCKYKDYLGNRDYKFIGLFHFEKFNDKGERVWTKVADDININKLTNNF